MDDIRLAFKRLLDAATTDVPGRPMRPSEIEMSSALIGIAQIVVKDIRRLADAWERQAVVEERIDARMAEMHERTMGRTSAPVPEPVVSAPNPE